jgi:hypothetical protein
MPGPRIDRGAGSNALLTIALRPVLTRRIIPTPSQSRLAGRSTCLVDGYSVDDRMIGEVEAAKPYRMSPLAKVRGAVNSSCDNQNTSSNRPRFNLPRLSSPVKSSEAVCRPDPAEGAWFTNFGGLALQDHASAR